MSAKTTKINKAIAKIEEGLTTARDGCQELARQIQCLEEKRDTEISHLKEELTRELSHQFKTEIQNLKTELQNLKTDVGAIDDRT